MKNQRTNTKFVATTFSDLLLIFLPQVDLGSLHLVCAVATQGNPGGNRDYVKRYKLQCSSDGVTWTVYEENGNTVSKSIRAFAKFTLCRTTEACATSFPGPLPSLLFSRPTPKGKGKVLGTRLLVTCEDKFLIQEIWLSLTPNIGPIADLQTRQISDSTGLPF